MTKTPKHIWVTYVGPESFFTHTGRSRNAKIHPYRFIPKHPVKITEPEDVEFFWKKRDRMRHFRVTQKKPSAPSEKGTKTENRTQKDAEANKNDNSSNNKGDA